MESDITAFLANDGASVTFSRTSTGHVMCVAEDKEKGRKFECEGPLPSTALSGALQMARNTSNKEANPSTHSRVA